jgi:NADH-quinone oxidoreductase subunit J
MLKAISREMAHMTIYAFIFYVVAALIIATTALAITRRSLVHAVVYLVFSFFGSAILFYLFGAPLLAALEVIIYAGAIMVLFLFVIIMIKPEASEQRLYPLRQWLPAAGFGLIYLTVGGLMVVATPGSEIKLRMALATPGEFARYVFQNHWLSIEAVSLLLLVALIGAFLLGKRENKNESGDEI